MQPHEDWRTSRRLAGLSPMTVPLDNPDRPSVRSSSTTTTANAANEQPTDTTSPNFNQQQPPPPPPPPPTTHQMPTGVDRQHFIPIDRRSPYQREPASIPMYATSEETRNQPPPQYPAAPPTGPMHYPYPYHTPPMNQNPYKYYSQQYPYAPYTPPQVHSSYASPTHDRMYEHLSTFQNQMMAQQQQHMQQMEQRFQTTMNKTVAAIAQSLVLTKHDETRHKSTTPPAEIAYSSD